MAHATAEACGDREMAHARSGLFAFLQDETGPELVEWAIVTFLVVIVSYTIMVELREELTDVFVNLMGRFLH